jgi:hypothetical protein
MPLSRLVFGLIALAVGAAPLLADWKPAPAPLMTKWGKQVTPDNAWQEYPRPQLVRKDWLNLNGLWDYTIYKRSDVIIERAGTPTKILVPYPIESALSGVGIRLSPEDGVWYSRSFKIPENWKGRHLLLHFGAVDWEAEVRVNGKSLGTHRGGFDPFSFDITSALKAGDNKLDVFVTDPTDQGAQPRGKQVLKPGGIFYTAVTGIWQTVWLEPVPEARIDQVLVYSDFDRQSVSISPKTSGCKPGEGFSVTIRSGGKVVAQSGLYPIETAASSKLRDPIFWSPDSPHLYDITVELARNPVDQVETYFAFRKIAVGKDAQGIPRLMLNGKPLFQVGPLDQGWWPDGLLTPPSDAAMRYDLEVLKKLGFNMLRKHIKVEPARLYYHCDKLGLLVWQDMPSGGVPSRGQFIAPNAKQDATFTAAEKAQFRAELKAMIDHLRFFPCVVAWVPFNEGWGQHDTNDILKWVKEYDPTRLVDGPSGWADRGTGDMKDMHNYPGPGMFPAMPERVSVLGEFGGLGLPLKGHLWKDTGNWGYRTFKTTDELRQNYKLLVHRLRPLIGKGLSAAVYTQTTDVESEVNGLMTYDREVIKLDVAETAKWHRALFGPPPEYRVVVPTSEQKPQKWRYTTAKPAAGWEKPDFDAAAWKEGEGGFGTKITPGAVVRTEWNAPDIWVRRSFELKDVPAGDLFLRIHHDEDAEVYVNGVLAAKLSGYIADYTEVPLTAEGRKALKAGANAIAVHCHQTGGGQYIDVGLVEVVEKK